MGKDQVIINDGASEGISTTASISSFSIGGDGNNDVKKIRIKNTTNNTYKYAHLLKNGSGSTGTMI